MNDNFNIFPNHEYKNFVKWSRYTEGAQSLLESMYESSNYNKIAKVISTFIEDNPNGGFCEDFQMNICVNKNNDVPVNYSFDTHTLTVQYSDSFDKDLFINLISIELCYVQLKCEHIQQLFTFCDDSFFNKYLYKHRNVETDIIPKYQDILKYDFKYDDVLEIYLYTSDAYKDYINKVFGKENDIYLTWFKYILFAYFIKR